MIDIANVMFTSVVGTTFRCSTPAQLAASGRTNAEIAAAAFVTVKTVEANLSRAYRKLGIRSRAQLARALDVVNP